MLAFLCFGCGGRSSILISTHHEHLLLLEDHDVGIIKELHKNFSISPPPRQWRRRQFCELNFKSHPLNRNFR